MKIIIVFAIAMLAGGCDWENIQNGAESTKSIVDTGERVAVSTSFLTGPYGAAAVPILGAISAIATAVATLANSKKKKVAKAAVEAADVYSGGGKAITDAAVANGVINEIKAAHSG